MESMIRTEIRMKAILVIDEPPCCGSCRLEHISLCMGTQKRRHIEDLNHYPSWCPLKPMPEKRETEFITTFGTKGWNTIAEGWNKCIEEIEDDQSKVMVLEAKYGVNDKN